MNTLCTECKSTEFKNINVIKENLFPPKTYLPNLNEIIVKNIQMEPVDEFANKIFFFYASESKTMLQTDNKYHSNMTQSEVYDDFENSGLGKFDSNGRTKIIMEKPINYGKKLPHLHFIMCDKVNQKNNWVCELDKSTTIKCLKKTSNKTLHC